MAKRFGVLLLVVLGLLLVLFYYQPYIQLFFIGLAIDLVESVKNKTNYLSKIVGKTLGILVVLVLYLGLLRLLQSVGLLSLSARAAIDIDVVVKAVWFVAFAWRDSVVGMHAYNVDPFVTFVARFPEAVHGDAFWSAFFSCAGVWVAVALYLGCAFLLAKRCIGVAAKIRFFIAWICIIGGSYCIHLAASTSWSPFRSDMALTAIVFLFFFAAIESLIKDTKMRDVAAGLIGVVGVFLAAVEIREWVSEPLACEWNAIKHDAAALGPVPKIVFVHTRAAYTSAPGMRMDMGWPAASRGWGEKEIIVAAWQAVGLAPPEVQLEAGAPGDAPQAPAVNGDGTPVVYSGCRSSTPP